MLVELYRNRARSLGVSIRDIAETLQLSYAGSRYGDFTMEGRQYWVQGFIEEEMRKEPSDLLNLSVGNSSGELVGMDNLVNLVESSSPEDHVRLNRRVSATFHASLAHASPAETGI